MQANNRDFLVELSAKYSRGFQTPTTDNYISILLWPWRHGRRKRVSARQKQRLELKACLFASSQSFAACSKFELASGEIFRQPTRAVARSNAGQPICGLWLLIR